MYQKPKKQEQIQNYMFTNYRYPILFILLKKMYILYLTLAGTTGGAPVYYFIVGLDKGSYVGSELATGLQNRLNTATKKTDGNNYYFSCSYSIKTNTITKL